MYAFKRFVCANFNLMLILGIVAGLLMPWIDMLPKSTAIILISILIFFSCSYISVSELKRVRLVPAFIFYIIRFVAFPVVVYYVMMYVYADIAIGALLVSLMPAAGASAAISGVLNANASLSLSLTIISSALVPFLLPLIFMLCVGDRVDVDVDVFVLFITLALSVFLPASIYFFIVRRVKPLRDWVVSEAKFCSISLIVIIVAVIVALQRDFIFENLDSVAIMVFWGSVLYFAYYALGWFLIPNIGIRERKSYAICSGANNTALAASIAAMYFSPPVVIFLVLTEFPWVIGLALFEKYASSKNE